MDGLWEEAASVCGGLAQTAISAIISAIAYQAALPGSVTAAGE
jgi:hypothetical protein